MPKSKYKKPAKKRPKKRPAPAKKKYKRKTSAQDNIRTGSKPHNRAMNLTNSTRPKLPKLYEENSFVFV